MNAEPVSVRHRRIGLGGIALAVAATLLTSACAAGQHAQTSDEKPTIDGVNGSVGAIDLRALSIQTPSDAPYYAPGTDAALRLVIVNSGTQKDTLTSITSSAATSWSSYRSAADAFAVQVADQAAAKASGSTSAGSAAPAQPKGSQQVTITPGTTVSYGVPVAKGELLLRKIKSKLYPGSSIKLTFTFARAGAVTLTVPVQLSGAAGTETVEEPSSTTEN